VLSRSVGYPALRLVHTELWLLFGAALWTAGYLLLRTRTGAAAVERIITLAPILTLAVLSIAVSKTVSGYADTTGAVVTTAHLLSLLLDGRDGTGTEHTSRVVGSTHRIPVRRRRSDGLDA
jgi:hypothetical protein